MVVRFPKDYEQRLGRLTKVGWILVSDSPPLSRNIGFKNPTYAADNVLIGRLKMTSQISWLLHYFQTTSPSLSSQEEPVIRQLAAEKFRVELHQNFVKLQNLVLHFAAFGYRQPRAVQAHD